MFCVLPSRRLRSEVILCHLAECDGAHGRRDPLRLGLALAHQRIDAVGQQLAGTPAALARLGQAEHKRAAVAVIMCTAVELVALLPMGCRWALCYEIQAA